MISSSEIAGICGVTAAQFRRDLSYMGEFGLRGFGYEIDRLIYQISKRLGITSTRPVVIIGAGRLGQALLEYKGFFDRGFEMVAIFDIDKNKIGRRVGSFVIRHVSKIEEFVKEEKVKIAVIATPAAAAQATVDLLSKCGIKAILNFAPVGLKANGDICIRHVDLASELQTISFHLARVEQGISSSCCVEDSLDK